MSAEAFRRAREVFLALCDLPEAEQDATLSAMCAGDLALEGRQLAQSGFQYGVSSPQDDVALGREGLGPDGLPPQDQVPGRPDGLPGFPQVIGSQRQEPLSVIVRCPQERHPLAL